MKYKQRADPRRILLTYAKHRAKRTGLTFNIGINDLTVPERCPVLGIPLHWRRQITNTGPHDDSPTIDRIDNTRGYEPGNVSIISMRANRLKNSMGLGEALAIYEYLLDQHERREERQKSEQYHAYSHCSGQ